MKRFGLLLIIFAYSCNLSCIAQSALVNTSESKFARLHGVGLGDVKWTQGFWADRFEICKNIMVPELWHTYTSDTICYAFQNFKIAAGLQKGVFQGPSFHDGDFYKTLEAVAAMFAFTKEPKLRKWMDEAISVIGKAQRADG